MEVAPFIATKHAAASRPSDGVTSTLRPEIQRHAAASTARNVPAGIASTAAARTFAAPPKTLLHCKSDPIEMAPTSSTTPEIQAEAMPGLRVASIRSPPAAAIATPNGKKAPSEWKYEPRV